MNPLHNPLLITAFVLLWIYGLCYLLARRSLRKTEIISKQNSDALDFVQTGRNANAESFSTTHFLRETLTSAQVSGAHRFRATARRSRLATARPALNAGMNFHPVAA